MNARLSRAKSMLCALSFVLLAVVLVIPSTTRAQPAALDGLNPQLIANASSPRDTLQSFLSLSQEMIETWRADGAPDRIYLLLKGLSELMDYSATADSARLYVQVNRILLLREVLDRIQLPPWSEVPGLEEATAQEIDVWTIPGTRLRLRRITEGTYSGEYAFTAGTVEDLHLTYGRMRHLPYRAGAIPIIEEWETTTDAFSFSEMAFEDRLSRIDTSSPRTVLTQFLRHVNIAYRIATDAEAQISASPATMSIEEAQAADLVATAHLLRASNAFDMSRVPKSTLEDVRMEASLALKEVLDRAILPPILEIPDASDVKRAVGDGGAFVWKFPGLPITISRIVEGDRAGSFTFDARTLEQLPATFNRLRDLPYQSRLQLRSEIEFAGDDVTSPGFYDFYISTPGSLVPSSTVLGRIVRGLPDWAKTLRGGATTWQWLGLALTVGVAFGLFAALQSLVSRTSQTKSETTTGWVRVLTRMAMIAILILLGQFVDQQLNITADTLSWYIVINRVIVLALTGWLIWGFFMALAATIAVGGKISERGIDASLLRILCGMTAIILAVIVVVSGLRDIGVDAVPLIAGLGVGGLAVALAIRPTLENLIGGLILHYDRPLRIGDYCDIGGKTGTIETIGVRSTRIRGLDRTLISIPNSRLSDMEIINYAHCDRMLISAVIGVRYETTPDQMRHLLTNIRRMLHAHPKIDRETVRIRYAGPAASSRDINIRIYVLTRDWNEFHAIREDVFLRIDDLVEASGIGYAFPSQTLYLTRDQQPDAERGAAAEAEVAAWRDANAMPFPRMDNQTMDELEGTLDYPPKGSNRSVHGETGPLEAPEPLSTEDRETKTGS